MKSLRKVSVVLALVAGVVVGCGGASGGSGGGEPSGAVRVAATTSVIRDLVEQVGGERVETTTIVPVGASPETFQPSPRDAASISEARVVFENGHGLDSWVDDLVESAGGEGQTIVEVSEGLEPIEGDEEHHHSGGDGDPHFWLDVENAEHYVEEIRAALVEADPEGAKEYRANAEDYLASLEKLDGYIEERARTIPEDRRKLVTTHEAFAYFARAYGFELEGSIIRNPEAEPSSREVAEVVNKVEEEDVPAVFTEPQFNSRLADTISREADVEVYELYSDTLVADESGNTYEAMMRTDIDRLVEGLG